MFPSISRVIFSIRHYSKFIGTPITVDTAVTEKILDATRDQISIKLYEHLYELPKYGVGRQFVRSIWLLEKHHKENKTPLSFWTITKFKPEENLRVGKVYGVLTWRGKTQDRVKRIKTGLKRHWQLVPKDLTIPIQIPPPRPKKIFTKPQSAKERTKTKSGDGKEDRVPPVEQDKAIVEMQQSL